MPLGARELSLLSHRALRFGSPLPATEIVPLTAEKIRARAPDVVTGPETINLGTFRPEPGGVFDPNLFGPDSRHDLTVPADEDADAPYLPPNTRFARIVLPVPIVHPLFELHAGEELAARIGWKESEISRAVQPEALNRLVQALMTAGLEALVLRELPMLPPQLRPVLDPNGNALGNDLHAQYRSVINRSNRFARLLQNKELPEILFQSELGLLRAAIHQLFENDEMPESAEPWRDDGERALASIRALCPPVPDKTASGTARLWWSLRALEADVPSIPGSYRFFVARSAMFAMGFELRPTA